MLSVLCVCVCRELEADKEALQLRVTEVAVENERLKSRVEELEERVRVYMGRAGEVEAGREEGEVEGGRGGGGWEVENGRGGGGWEERWRVGGKSGGSGIHTREGGRGGEEYLVNT